MPPLYLRFDDTGPATPHFPLLPGTRAVFQVIACHGLLEDLQLIAAPTSRVHNSPDNQSTLQSQLEQAMFVETRGILPGLMNGVKGCSHHFY